MRLNFYDAPQKLSPETKQTVEFWQSVRQRFFDLGFEGYAHTSIFQCAMQGGLIIVRRLPGGNVWEEKL